VNVKKDVAATAAASRNVTVTEKAEATLARHCAAPKELLLKPKEHSGT
jgi:hypothetical protein